MKTANPEPSRRNISRHRSRRCSVESESLIENVSEEFHFADIFICAVEGKFFYFGNDLCLDGWVTS
jgi:hypothetical protein